MSVELTPNGTYGARWPWLPRRLMPLADVLMTRLLPRMGLPILRLTTVGAKSGLRRTVPLGWFPDGQDAWLVVGSCGGAARHPAWYVNMARHPEEVWIEIGNRRVHVRPESLQGPARDEAWLRVIAASPYYADYQKKTDRQIPIVRLTPVD